MSASHPVKKLNTEVARKIAAGEVIDRPAAIVRELLDNAVDSGATQITVELISGGIESVRVVDNGSGMTREDLAACAYPHSTSKIETETDLLNLTTLGFRGEALSSIAAVARLSIASGTNKMRASITEDHIIEPCPEVAGTIVEAAGLFENFPARRRFLKRPSAELAVCRNTFIEKSMARPDIAFRLVADGNISIDLPRGQTLTERFLEATGIRENAKLFTELQNYSSTAKSSAGENSYAGGETQSSAEKVSKEQPPQSQPDFSFRLIIGEPGVYRSSRKDIYIFVNGRRVTEFSLVQAVEYGGQGYFPNGTFPVAALFVQMNPSLVDFNIHPAKREVRFHDSSALHHSVSTTTRAFFHSYTMRTMLASDVDETEAATADLFSSENFLLGKIGLPSTSENDNTSLVQDSRSKFLSDFGRPSSAKQAATTSDSYTSNVSQTAPRSENSMQTTPRSAYNRVFSASQTSQPRYKIEHTNKDAISEIASAALEISDSVSPEPNTSAPGVPFHYLGRALGTFIVAEKGNTLYFVDQHAAHERILYNSIMAHQGKRQNLLVPYIIETDSEKEDSYLEQIKEPLDAAGFSLKNCGDGKWEISAVPERWTMSESETYRAIMDRRTEPSELIGKIAAMTACKAAVKDGYILDDQTAAMLAEAALALPDPHCPHGRPVFSMLTRAQMFALVKRT